MLNNLIIDIAICMKLEEYNWRNNTKLPRLLGKLQNLNGYLIDLIKNKQLLTKIFKSSVDYTY